MSSQNQQEILINDLLGKLKAYSEENQLLRKQMEEMEQNAYIDCDGVSICEQLETILIECDHKFNGLSVRESFEHMIKGINEIIIKRKSKKHSMTYLSIAKESLLRKLAHTDEALSVAENLRKQNIKLTNDLIRMTNRVEDANNYLLETHDKVKDYKDKSESIRNQALMQQDYIQSLINQIKDYNNNKCQQMPLDRALFFAENYTTVPISLDTLIPQDNNDIACPMCKIIIPNDNNGKEHIRICDGIRPCCPLCFKLFKNPSELDAHINFQHLE
jgi:hypothetical protein